MIDPETEYLMVRAKEEAVLAIQAGHPDAAAAHQELSVRYSAKAVIILSDADADENIVAANPDCSESRERAVKVRPPSPRIPPA